MHETGHRTSIHVTQRATHLLIHPKYLVSLSLLARPRLRLDNLDRIRVAHVLIRMSETGDHHLVQPRFDRVRQGKVEPAAFLARAHIVALVLTVSVHAADLVRDQVRRESRSAFLGY